ncbi:MAG: SMP-30/gluconolactonase/LRE family protein [Novosphingobium sp.]|nr:SMP-30/gluconolactonase/LRE family protein [Novosphingobium sp.]
MEKLFSGGDFFEGPRWHDGFWWVSDIFGGRVFRVSRAGEGEVVAEVPGWPNGLGFMPDGDLIIASLRERKLLRRDSSGRLSLHGDLSALSPYWLNDILVDAQGRAWVGNLGVNLENGSDPEPTTLCRIDPDGTGEVVADGLLFPNGMAVTRDGRTLVVGESMGNRMSAFTIGADGSLSDRRVWAEFGPVPSRSQWTMASLHDMELSPDGCAIDAEDCIWLADAGNRRVCRVAEGGRILEEMRVPGEKRIYACALGGVDGRTLVICAAPSSDFEQLQGKGLAALWQVTVKVPVV